MLTPFISSSLVLVMISIKQHVCALSATVFTLDELIAVKKTLFKEVPLFDAHLRRRP